MKPLKNKKILIIDAMNLTYRAYHAYRHLKNGGIPTNIIFGGVTLINALMNQFRPDEVFICWDGKRSPERLKLNPNYKAGRRTKTEEEKRDFYNQVLEVRKLIHTLGLKQILNPDMEGDDIIYLLVKKYSKIPTNKITIISTDKDFHQLIKPNVRIYNTASNKLVHSENCKLLYGYTPQNCVDYLCMVGDDSDNIKGVRGIGETGAKGILQEFSSIKKFLESDKPFGKVNKETLETVWRTNRQLISLRVFYKRFIKGKYKNPIQFYNNIPNPKFDRKGLMSMCKKYNINNFLKPEFMTRYKKMK